MNMHPQISQASIDLFSILRVAILSWSQDEVHTYPGLLSTNNDLLRRVTSILFIDNT